MIRQTAFPAAFRAARTVSVGLAIPGGRRTKCRRLVCLAWMLLVLASPIAVSPVAADPPSRTEQPSGQIDEPPITEADREHWSFQPLTRPAIPQVNDESWCENPIDRFVLAELERRQLAPQPAADRTTLIRRLSFDLTGLPPTPEQVDAFLADPSHDAYQRLVDRLLASDDFGPHWAQRWLDLARFAETDGFEHDKIRANAWQYRDWVVGAMNRDLPYDRFLHLQIAGDQIAPSDPAASIATAFCLSGPDMPDINSQDERRHHLLNEMTATVGEVFLGLQFGCAQCHDHKYDPISQADFYRLRAIFDPAVQVKKNQSVSTLSVRSDAAQPSYLMIRGDWQRRGPAVEPAFPRIVDFGDDDATQANADTPSKPGTTNRRKAFAQWLTARNQPLTARVIVNRIWQAHFGRGLSETPSDFGVIGDSPSHPELLDWLATEFIRQQWSLKRLHRFVVTSATYRQASSGSGHSWQENLERDPKNRWLSRFPRRRLTGEAVRDAMLAAAGVLNTERGGPGVMPPLPEELRSTLLRNQWNESPDPASHDRRSIYVFARRNLRFPIFDAFDRPDGNASCAVRSRSTTAPQSLLLLNSRFSLQTAQRTATAIMADVEKDRWITAATRPILGRFPTADEERMFREFLKQQSEILETTAGANPLGDFDAALPADVTCYEATAFADLCLALFNSSEFLYID